MKLSNFDKPDPNNPVIPDLHITPQQFSQMTLATQLDIVGRNQMIGDKGVANPTWDVPPMCRHGVTLGELSEQMEALDHQFQHAAHRKAQDINYMKRLRAQNEKNELNN